MNKVSMNGYFCPSVNDTVYHFLLPKPALHTVLFRAEWVKSGPDRAGPGST